MGKKLPIFSAMRTMSASAVNELMIKSANPRMVVTVG